MFHDVYYTRFDRLDTGQLESADLYLTPIDWHFRSGDSLHSLLDLNLVYERLFAPFEIAPGVVLPPGEYRFTRFKSPGFSSATKRRVAGSFSVAWGDYWSGRAEQVTAGASLKLPPWVTLVFSSNQTFAHLPEGRFIARVFTTTANVAFSPLLAWSNLLQYDNRSRNLGWQSRLRWTLQPGRDLFLVLSQGWIQDEAGGGRFHAGDSKVSTKAQYTFRF
jgi:hypothetical protein